MRALVGTGLLLGLAAACATIASAQATGKRLTVAAYRAQANAICSNERGETMSAYTHSATLPEYFDTEVPIVGKALASLKKLKPPVQLASLHARILTTVTNEFELFTLFQQEVKAGVLTTAQWQQDPQPRQLADQELALWRKVGTKVCGR